jgi:hypothetical protein
MSDTPRTDALVAAVKLYCADRGIEYCEARPPDSPPSFVNLCRALERELAEEKAEHRATLEHAAKEREAATSEDIGGWLRVRNDEPAPVGEGRLERALEVRVAELAGERARFQHVFQVLCGIYQLLDPPAFQHNGQTMVFVNPDAAKVLHELSNRIRAIPDALKATPEPVHGEGGRSDGDRVDWLERTNYNIRGWDKGGWVSVPCTRTGIDALMNNTSPVDTAGWVSVPAEPTDAMLAAGTEAASGYGTPYTRVANGYKAMIAAAGVRTVEGEDKNG